MTMYLVYLAKNILLHAPKSVVNSALTEYFSSEKNDVTSMLIFSLILSLPLSIYTVMPDRGLRSTEAKSHPTIERTSPDENDAYQQIDGGTGFADKKAFPTLVSNLGDSVTTVSFW